MRRRAFVFALLAWLSGCGGSASDPPAKESAQRKPESGLIEIPPDSPKLAHIRVAEVELAELPADEFTAPGQIEVNPNRVSKVLLPVPGRVTDVMVAFGDAVEKNQPLLRMESPDADAAISAYLSAESDVAQAEAALHKAVTDLGRVQDLFRGDAIAKKEVVAAETAVAQAKAVVRQAQASLQQARARLDMLELEPGVFRQKIVVRAPLSGKITEMTVVAGEYRNDLSTPVLTIADLSTVWVSADVPESSIRMVKLGERFDVTLAAYPGEIFQSRVARIADRVDPQTRTIEVWAELANPQGRFRTEMFGEVRHVEEFRETPAVPVGAVVQAQNKTIVYRELSKGRFQPVEVVAGKRSGNLFPILRGLKQGDRIVVDGAMLLRGH